MIYEKSLSDTDLLDKIAKKDKNEQRVTNEIFL